MLKKIVEEYLSLYPNEKDGLKGLLEQLGEGEDLSDRKNFKGHVAASAVILSPDQQKVLLIYHPSFKRWQQPGGHWDPDEAGPWLAAEREAIEETGVKIAKRLEAPDHLPLLIESHPVPVRPEKNEPAHVHHAFWYAFVAVSEDIKLEDDVIKEAKWLPTSQIADPKMLKVLERSKKFIS